MMDTHPFKTISRTFTGELQAKLLCMTFIHLSAWFEMTPLPDDQWKFTVKEENSAYLRQVSSTDPLPQILGLLKDCWVVTEDDDEEEDEWKYRAWGPYTLEEAEKAREIVEYINDGAFTVAGIYKAATSEEAIKNAKEE